MTFRESVCERRVLLVDMPHCGAYTYLFLLSTSSLSLLPSSRHKTCINPYEKGTIKMPKLSFSLKPSALLQLHDALVCLSKFNESVSIEAEYDLVSLQLRQ
jgi:hypothetical protein